MDLSEQVMEFILWDGWVTQEGQVPSRVAKKKIEMSKVDITDNALTNKDGEILRLLNQIASDIVKRSDVDEIVKDSVTQKEGQRWQEVRKMTSLNLSPRLFAHSELQAL